MSLFKVQQPLSLKQQAYEGIKNAIILHKIPPGSTLFERDLSESLGISRTPVREAIPLLELEGWVKSIPRKGTFVSQITAVDVEEVIQIRRALEILVIELLIPKITEREIEQLNEIYVKQRGYVEDSGQFISTDKDFHIYLAQLSGNHRLINLMGTISDQIRWFGVSALNLPNRTEQTLKEHAWLIECLKNKEVEKAKEAVLEHIEHTRVAILSSLNLGD
ncbi:GntR family transcriptional regulator [Bacillus sp. SA1-12]|uniref:GntR family transcriptional regulator n=1 Tax=Bacillus sp. SA1-12 TaxID=1455638 RepID=UPI0006264BBA|nr:GntR family transcriptional regulator [Bacillus sp. SA1-12]KKI92733.1 GntR family transcriptional regulator [Bacillus sp. SA1-12]